ncbi:MAG TPA: VOC family protein [Cytophagales bacterium]|nr:VOC family protein [Cytophagales bacterium]
MATFNPYLNFNGNTEEAFLFYKSVLGGELFIQRFKDTEAGSNMPAQVQDKIMHISLPLSNGNILMGTDVLESMGQEFVAGNNFSICISADSEEEANALFNGLSAGGTIEMPLQQTFWGSYFGMFADKFGIQWMVDYAKK